jgi:hypothetical protein
MPLLDLQKCHDDLGRQRGHGADERIIPGLGDHPRFALHCASIPRSAAV